MGWMDVLCVGRCATHGLRGGGKERESNGERLSGSERNKEQSSEPARERGRQWGTWVPS